MSARKLPRRFYTRAETLTVAQELLGKLLVVPDATGNRVSGRIVETEAYMGPDDKGAHSFGNRRTKRTEPMFGIGGYSYVYFVYGMHYQFNVVSNIENIPHAILVRAVEPVESIELMCERRQMEYGPNLTNGPGKLCQAMGIDISYTNQDLLGDRIWIERTSRTAVAESDIASGPRVGIDYAGEYVDVPWRFWLKSSAFVSRAGRSRKTTG
jgi:DNA-3-methyladenine glycosylase